MKEPLCLERLFRVRISEFASIGRCSVIGMDPFAPAQQLLEQSGWRPAGVTGDDSFVSTPTTRRMEHHSG